MKYLTIKNKTMKLPLLIILLAAAGLSAQSQVDQKIKSNNKILKIKFTGKVDGNPVNYNRTFDVKGMSPQQTAL